MTIQALAYLCLAFYIGYGLAFYAEGLETQGSIGVKVLGALAEASMIALAIWAIS